jgi:hypothetical protein
MKTLARFAQLFRNRIQRLPKCLLAASFALLALGVGTAQAQPPEVRLLLPPSNSSLPLLLLAEQDPQCRYPGDYVPKPRSGTGTAAAR